MIIRQRSFLRKFKKDSSNEQTNYKLVRPGDIAYNKIRAAGRSRRVTVRGLVNPGTWLCDPKAARCPLLSLSAEDAGLAKRLNGGRTE